MAELRRSGRIAREISILVVGTDVSGRVFSEETKTVLLSRHGAGILSHYKIAPEEILTMRLPGDKREAVIRLVGQMGERPDGYIYGVAFCDPNLDFWRGEFPADSPFHHPAKLETTPCECVICHHREFFRHSEIETDVFAAAERILRYCKNCGQTTHWTLVNPNAPAPAPVSAPRAHPAANADSLAEPSQGTAGIASATLAPLGNRVSASAASPANSAAAAEVAHLAELAASETSAPATRNGKENRRRHVRTRVSFTASVRQAASGEEIVECDNVSKGGFCFRSRRQYLEHSIIEASVPYTPGWTPIYVSGEIRHVEALPGNMFKYGVAYLKPSFEP